MAAHKESATVLSVCPLQSSLFATGSEDGKVRTVHMQRFIDEVACLAVEGVAQRERCHAATVGGEKNVERWRNLGRWILQVRGCR